jgi:UDP-N-acetylglucosamine--N-acetylmuramyl-(pentapeptide) pyrophosphoryl-undecaprenol N-acetylglucosamine transferase
MRLLIAGGGTGGHIYPALAVARSLRARPAAAEVDWLGGHRGLEASLVPPAGIRVRRLFLRSLRSAGRDIHLVLDPIRLALSIPQAFVLLLLRRPAAIFTTGGYVAIPTLIAASVLRIPSVLWEGNVVPGRSVRFVARLATLLAVSYAETATALGRDGAYVTGTPIRSLAGVDPDVARATFGGRPGERILLVFGGSTTPSSRRSRDSSSGSGSCTSPATPGTPRPSRLANGCRPTCGTATGPTRSCTPR